MNKRIIFLSLMHLSFIAHASEQQPEEPTGIVMDESDPDTTLLSGPALDLLKVKIRELLPYLENQIRTLEIANALRDMGRTVDSDDEQTSAPEYVEFAVASSALKRSEIDGILRGSTPAFNESEVPDHLKSLIYKG